MKQIEKVSIGGYAFTLDQDAYAAADQYLGELGRYYAGSEGGPEILEGIEERMAELLRERCGGGIVSRNMVEAVIAIIGRPEELEEGDSGSQAGMTGEKAGMTGKTGPDPEPRSAESKAYRAGKETKGTLKEIERMVKSGANEVDKAVNKFNQSSAGSAFSNFVGRFIGIILLIVGFAGLFTGGVLSFGSGLFRGFRKPHLGAGDMGFLGLHRLYGHGMAQLYDVSPTLATLLMQPGMHILLLLVVFLPFLWILYEALQLIFGFKSPKWHPGLVIFILWLLSIIAFGILIAIGFMSAEMITI